MASACLNTIGLSPENLHLLDSSYRWFSPRLKTARNLSDLPEVSDPAKNLSNLPDESESDKKEFDGFEFRLEDPAMMLPADELFSDGKLIPLQSSVTQPEVATSTITNIPESRNDDVIDPPYLYSPRAPRCSSRWKELLGFGRLYQNSNNTSKVNNKQTTSLHNGATRSIRQLLYKNSKPVNDSSINIPLLNNNNNNNKDSDNESVSISSRPSIDNLPRLSLDSENMLVHSCSNSFGDTSRKTTRKSRFPPDLEDFCEAFDDFVTKTSDHKPVKLNRVNVNMNNINPNNRTKTRTTSTDDRSRMREGRSTMRRRSTDTGLLMTRGLSVDSPRMNSSGKIVFHSLERSSSSPSSLIGGPRFKHRGLMERSYSGNVRVTPVLNVPVCSLRGIFSSSQQKRDVSSSGNNGGSNRSQRFNGKSRGDCC